MICAAIRACRSGSAACWNRLLVRGLRWLSRQRIILVIPAIFSPAADFLQRIFRPRDHLSAKGRITAPSSRARASRQNGLCKNTALRRQHLLSGVNDLLAQRNAGLTRPGLMRRWRSGYQKQPPRLFQRGFVGRQIGAFEQHSLNPVELPLRWLMSSASACRGRGVSNRRQSPAAGDGGLQGRSPARRNPPAAAHERRPQHRRIKGYDGDLAPAVLLAEMIKPA